MVLILTLNIAMVILNNLVNAGQRVKGWNKKSCRYLMKDNEQKTIHSLRFTGK